MSTTSDDTPFDPTESSSAIPDHGRERLHRAEEHAAFLEHTVDQLNEQLLRAFDTIQRLDRRMQNLESRIAGIESNTGSYFTPDPDERPPHSAPPKENDP